MGVSEVLICIELLFGLDIGITIIVMSQVGTGCDTTDAMGLNLSAYLLLQGICEIVLILGLMASILSTIIYTNNSKTSIVSRSSECIFVLSALFATAWFIIGCVILFRSNIDCINTGGAMAIYALVIWCLIAYQVWRGKSRAKTISGTSSDASNRV
jgi:hypothetical protein